MTGCEALAGLALFACLARDPRCVPEEHRPMSPALEAWVAATVEHESGFRPYAVRDEAERRGHFFATHAEAVAFAVERDARGRTLGLGLGQITHRANWRRHTGKDGPAAIAELLTPCSGLRAAVAHYAADLHVAASAGFNSGVHDPTRAPASSVAYAMRVRASAARLLPLLARDDGAPPSPAAAPAPPPPPAVPLAVVSRPAPRRAAATATPR